MPFKLQPQAIKDANDATGDVVSIMNSGAVDRTGETLSKTGWLLDNFKSSGVITFNHSQDKYLDPWWGLPIAARRDAWMADEGLLVHYQYLINAPGKLGELAQAIYYLEKTPGAMAGHSVWFEPFAWSDQDGSSGTRDYGDQYPRMPVKGRVYTRQALIECGPVLIPAEPKSVTLTVKAFEDRGLDVPAWARTPMYQSAEEWRAMLAGKTMDAPADQRAGRVISAANLSKLQAALDAIQRVGDVSAEAIATLNDVIKAGEQPGDDPADDSRSRPAHVGAVPGFDPLASLADVLRSIDGAAIARRSFGGN